MYDVNRNPFKYPAPLPPPTGGYNKSDIVSCRQAMEGAPKTLQPYSSNPQTSQESDKMVSFSDYSNLENKHNYSHSPNSIMLGSIGSRYYSFTETQQDNFTRKVESPVNTSMDARSISPAPVIPNIEMNATTYNRPCGPSSQSAEEVLMGASANAESLVIELKAEAQHEPISITVFSGSRCLTPVYSLVDAAVRICFDRVEFVGELLSVIESGSVTNVEDDNQKKKLGPMGLPVVTGISPMSSKCSTSQSLSHGHDRGGGQTRNQSQYSLHFEEIDLVDILGDRVVLLCGTEGLRQYDSVAVGQRPPLKSITVYCHDNITLATSIGKILKKRCKDQQDHMVSAEVKRGRVPQTQSVDKQTPCPQIRYDPYPCWDEPLKTGKLKQNHPRSTLTIPPTYHSSTGLIRRNFSEAANDFKSIYKMLVGGTSGTQSDRSLSSSSSFDCGFFDTNQNKEQQTNLNIQIKGEYYSDDVTKGSLPPKRCGHDPNEGGYDPTTIGRDLRPQQLSHLMSLQCDNVTKDMVELNPLAATPLSADYRSYYPTLRSPYVSNASPSHPYLFMTQQKATETLLHSQLNEKLYQAHEKEVASIRKVQLLEDDIKQMKEQIDAIKLAQDVMVRPSRLGTTGAVDLSKCPALFNILGENMLSVPPKGIIDFDTILDPTIESKLLHVNNDPFTKSISANKARATVVNTLAKYGRDNFGASMLLSRRASTFKGPASAMRSISSRKRSQDEEIQSLSKSNSLNKIPTEERKPVIVISTGSDDEKGSDDDLSCTQIHIDTRLSESDDFSPNDLLKKTRSFKMQDSPISRRASQFSKRASVMNRLSLGNVVSLPTTPEKSPIISNFDVPLAPPPPPKLPPPPKKLPPPPPPPANND